MTFKKDNKNPHQQDTHATIILLGILLISAFSGRAADYDTLSEAKGKNGMVVSVSPQATEVGLQILKSGGNAVDAAIAVEFALAVTWPEAGNIAGGGFMMVHPPGERAVCIEYRERAPEAASEKMFSSKDGKHTHKIVGVPGTVHGMATAHKKFGKLDWAELILPAVKLAGEGFLLDEAQANSINGVIESKATQEGKHHQELIRVYEKPGTELAAWKANDRIFLPDLAKTLRRIAEQGTDGFYKGETAKLLVEEMKRGGGLISLNDLKNYRAVVRPAVQGKFRGYDIYGAALPSSGGTCVIQMLNMIEQFDLSKSERYSADTLHLITEVMKRAFCDRARYLGDSDFVKIPPRLTRKHYAKKLTEDIDMQYATPSVTMAPEIDIKYESPSTTHFSVIDKDGLAVSNTTTLEASWGARIVVKGAGFVLNNEMGDFNWFPDHTDTSGKIGTKPNRIFPGKRMLSSQSPMIIAYKGHPVLVTGSPGGRTIINTSFQMILNVIEFKMDLPAAMRAGRIHHQWLPDRILYENHAGMISEATITELERRGHKTIARKSGSRHGDAHSIFINIETGEYHGVADWRRDGKALGF